MLSRLAIVGLTAVLLAACGGDDAPEPKAAPPVAKGEARVRGEVIENDLGCERDGPCFLRLRTGSGDLRVVYHFGESPPCPNTAAIRAGQQIKKGDQVEVYGRYQHSGGERILSTCPSAAYEIRRL